MSDPVSPVQDTPTQAPEEAPAEPDVAPPTDALQSPPEAPGTPVERRPVETWAHDRRTPAWVFASAKTMHRWPEGVELAAEDYDAACEAARNEVIR